MSSTDRWLKKMRAQREAGAIFVALWVRPEAAQEGEAELIYYLRQAHDGEILKIEVTSENRSIPSLYGLFGAADWAEREACAEYRIKFVGNPNLNLVEEGC